MHPVPETKERDDISTQEILALVQEGKDALDRGDLTNALRSFESVVARFPERPEGYNNLGALYTSLGQFEKAETCFNQVLNLLPGNCNVHYNRGIVRIRLQRYCDAIADFDQVLTGCPEDADCWNNLGVATFLKGDYSTARGQFQRALELVPNYPNALLNLCDTEIADGKHEAARTVCEGFLSQHADADVRRKLLDLMDEEIQQLLGLACKTAEDLLRQEANDTGTRVRLGCLLKARETLAPPAPASS